MSTEDEFQSLLSSSRIAFEQGDPQKSLDLCYKALQLKTCPKLLKKIERIKEYIASQEKENLNDNIEEPGVSPVEELASHLLSEAREKFEVGDLQGALGLLKESYKCVPSEKTAKKIAKIEEAIEHVNNDISVDPENNTTPELSKPDPEQMIAEARQLYQAGKLTRCIQLLYEVQKIAPSDKIQRKIDRIEAYLEQNRNESPTSEAPLKDLVLIAEGLKLPRGLYEKLYPYQREGVQWLWRLHNTAPGGVLADDMGLGKTVQVISFLCGLFISKREPFTALVVMPVSVLVTWEAELKRWAPALRVSVFHDQNRVTRLRYLSAIQRQGGILLTTYGMVTSSFVDLTTDVNADPQFLRSGSRTAPDERHGPEFHWTYLILDEAHKIKNPAAKATKAILSVSAQHRILLTGTAVQNNLSELWSLYNCTHGGRLLGRMQTFKTEYEKPITRAREKDANRAERTHGQLMASSLRKLIDPYFLRRTKAEVLSSNKQLNQCDLPLSQMADLQIMEEMPKKTELVVWLYLRKIQERSYRDFLELDQVKELLLRTSRRSPLMELVILKKLCDHPRLLSHDQCLSLNLAVTQPLDGQISKRHLPPASQLMDESGKLYFLGLLLNSFLRDAEQQLPYPPRTLIFSQSLRLLDMAEKVILSLNERPENVARSRRHRVLRLDGRLSKVEERLHVIRLFEKDTSYTVMLLTTQVGGVGLTLTAANRVIILDPSWNPATDAQAVDRAYRIGQRSDVVVYRLITCATVEEKIYRRQIFKDSVIRQTTCSSRNKIDHDPYRYFTHQDLRELFTLGDTRVSKTQEQLMDLHAADEKWEDAQIRPHLIYLTGSEMRDSVFGLSFHDLMFSRAETHEPLHPTAAVEAVREQELLQNRLAAAEFAIARECADATVSARTNPVGMITKPESLPIAYRPPGDVFLVPSRTDSKRPMLNRTHLGRVQAPPRVSPPAAPQPVVGSTFPDGSVDVAEQLATSLREMSISQAAISTGVSDVSHSANHSEASCVILSGASNSNSPVSASDFRDSSHHSSRQEHSLVFTEHKSNTCEDRSQPSSSANVQSSHTPSTRDSSKTSFLATESPLPSSVAFRGFVKASVFRSTPVSARKAAPPVSYTPMSPGTPMMKPRERTEPSSDTSSNKLQSSRSSQAPTVSDPRSLPPPTSPSSESESDDSDGVLMDITANLDDEQFHRTVDMKSVHEILAKSGLVDAAESEQADETDSFKPSVCLMSVVEDSYASPSKPSSNPVLQDVVEDSLQIIEDSLTE